MLFLKTKIAFFGPIIFYLITIGKLDEITIYCPIPGDTFMEIDSDFGRIETQISRKEKFFVPSEYAKIIEISNSKNPIQVPQV